MRRTFFAILLGWSGVVVAQGVASTPLAIGFTETIHSTTLGEDRMLNIALPQGYHPDSAARYPVIYLLDGGADEDFIHVTGALHFAAFEWIAWQPPSIVVGIVNVDRKRDLTFPTTIAADREKFPTTGGSAAFMRFIAEEVIPFVDGNYRTNGERMLIGQSLGGLFAAEVLIKHPELFNRYLIVSPSIWWDDGSLLKKPATFITDPVKAPKAVYIAVGKEGKRMESDAKRLYALVKKEPKVRSGFVFLPQHDHANILHQAVVDGFRWLAGK